MYIIKSEPRIVAISEIIEECFPFVVRKNKINCELTTEIVRFSQPKSGAYETNIIQ